MFGSYIGDRWITETDLGVIQDANPSDPSDIIGTSPICGEHEVDLAVSAAQDAAASWKASSPIHRSEVLLEAARRLHGQLEALATLQTREMGKALWDTKGHASSAEAFLHYFAGEAFRLSGQTLGSSRQGVAMSTRPEPKGVVLLITPWNFPVSITAKKISAALAAGNTVVLKPSEMTPGVANALVEAIVGAGLPPGVLNLVTGDATTGRLLVAHHGIDAVSFTGSTATGQNVIESASKHGATIQAEMGGKNAAVVLADADLRRAAHHVVTGAFKGAGQVCTATSRLIVESAVYDEVLGYVLEEATKLKVGNPLDNDTYLGPIVSQQQLDRVNRFISLGREEGTILMGGSHVEPAGAPDGYFVEPTVIADVDPSSPVSQEEIFGPVLSAYRVDDLEEGIELSNGTRYGLCGAIHTSSIDKANRFLEQLEAGCVGANTSTAGWEIQAPFGGFKDSGYGPKEQGEDALDFFTRVKTIAFSA